jgi:hypothetical protein
MPILTSADGKLYVIPAEKLASCRVPPEDVEEKLKASGVNPPPGIHPQQTKEEFDSIRLCLKR